jgi:hypothetical protein
MKREEMMKPGPAEEKELKALMFDLHAVMKKHDYIAPEKSLISLLSVIDTQAKALLKKNSKDLDRRLKILSMMQDLFDVTMKSIENGYPLFEEEIDAFVEATSSTPPKCADPDCGHAAAFHNPECTYPDDANKSGCYCGSFKRLK